MGVTTQWYTAGSMMLGVAMAFFIALIAVTAYPNEGYMVGLVFLCIFLAMFAGAFGWVYHASTVEKNA
jgi:hypothetical protein